MKLFINEPSARSAGPIEVYDEDHNDIAEFFHNEHATVEQSYETALALANKLTAQNDLQALRANLQEAWAALAMIRETVETLAPSGSVKGAEYLDGPTFMHEADALVAGIMAIAK